MVLLSRWLVLGPEFFFVEGVERQNFYLLKKLGNKLLAVLLIDDKPVVRIIDGSFELVFFIVLEEHNKRAPID